MTSRLNLGRNDRIVRLVAGIALIFLAAWGLPTAALTAIVWTAGAILFATGATGFCPLYALLGIDTRARALRHRGAGARR